MCVCRYLKKSVIPKGYKIFRNRGMSLLGQAESQEIGGISLSGTSPGIHLRCPSIFIDFLRRVCIMRGTNIADEIRAIFHSRVPLNKCAGSSREREK